MLWALIDWTENGRAPAQITATRIAGGQEAFTRQLCPFPQAQDAQGRCVTDPVLAAMLRQ